MNTRPTLKKKIAPEDFKAFYWLKKELVAFCREEGLKTTGSKIQLTEQITQYLLTGKKATLPKTAHKKIQSTFDWNKEKLELSTEITDSYKNSENVRKFFEAQIGKQFKFNVVFMNWMKANTGKTLSDAITAWKRLRKESKNNTTAKDIAPQFEYNRYIRDFMKDNPGVDRKVAIQCWMLKKSRRGDNVYDKADLAFL